MVSNVREAFADFYQQLQRGEQSDNIGSLPVLLREFDDRTMSDSLRVGYLAKACCQKIAACEVLSDPDQVRHRLEDLLNLEDPTTLAEVKARIDLVDQERVGVQSRAYECLEALQDLLKCHNEQEDWNHWIDIFKPMLEELIQGFQQVCQEFKPLIDGLGRVYFRLQRFPGACLRKVPYNSQQQRARNRIIIKKKADVEFGYETVINDDTDGGKWILVKDLGGGMAVANLWVRVGEDGAVRQRVVRKDTYSGFSPSELADITRFERGTPMEWITHLAIREQEESYSFVETRSFEVDIPSLYYRFYTTYCPMGDLGELIAKYRDRPMPKSYIWMVLDTLIDCGNLMETGTVSGDTVPDWKQVVHRDLKPGNIFLDLVDDRDDWPAYPQPKVGDFGLAIHTSITDRLNPLIYNLGAGTKGYYPPEQQSYMNVVTCERVDAFKVLAHTNVWGVGAIMWCLLHQKLISSKDQPNYRWDQVENKFTHAIDDFAKIRHPALAKLTERCLSFDPKDRPSFRQLREWVTGHMPISVRDVKDGRAQDTLQGLPTEAYKIGMAFQQVA